MSDNAPSIDLTVMSAIQHELQTETSPRSTHTKPNEIKYVTKNHCFATRVMVEFICACTGLSWTLFILFMVCQPTMNDVHSIITSTFDSTATELPPPLYEECKLTWTNIKSQISVFLFFHFLRYFLTSLFLRNRLLLYTNSILWEVTEFSFFNSKIFSILMQECWWDSIFFDILFMNLLGIEVGLLFLKIFNHFVSINHQIIVYSYFTKILCCKVDIDLNNNVNTMTVINNGTINKNVSTNCKTGDGGNITGMHSTTTASGMHSGHSTSGRSGVLSTNHNNNMNGGADDDKYHNCWIKSVLFASVVFFCVFILQMEELFAFMILRIVFWMDVASIVSYYRALCYFLIFIFSMSQLHDILMNRLYTNWIRIKSITRNDIKFECCCSLTTFASVYWIWLLLVTIILELILVIRAYSVL